MKISLRELQLTNDLLLLQNQCNEVVKRNLTLRKEIDELQTAFRKEQMECEVEVKRLQDIVDRATKFEAVSTTMRRKKKESSARGSV